MEGMWTVIAIEKWAIYPQNNLGVSWEQVAQLIYVQQKRILKTQAIQKPGGYIDLCHSTSGN